MEEKKFFDFNGEETFNLDVEYSTLFNEGEPKQLNPNDSKLKDAESIIEEFGAKYIERVSLVDYEKVFLNINTFLIQFNVEADAVKEMTKLDRDKLFGYGKELFKTYENMYSNLKFNFELSMKEWNYIDHTLTKKLSYNGQELFNYWELYMKFIEPTRGMMEKTPKTMESFVPVCSIQSLILLSHLLMKHEEKASTESFHYFRTTLTEIAKMTRLFNAYGVMLERITNRFNHWINALNAMDGFNNDYRTDENEQPQQ
jgi:lantibiotic modifying enzyme